MSKISLRETIKETIRYHLKEKNGLVMGQCLTAVGWVGGTLPELYEDDGMIELSMADVAGGGFVVGAALSGRKPIYVIRYQGFNWFNSPIILNYACKSKEIWGIPCPMLIRSVGMEGSIGPVAGSSHHSLYYRMPGIKIVSPMSPNEYKKVYNDFIDSEDVVYVSEHRKSYDNKQDLKDIIFHNPDLTLFAISITRFEAIEASKNLSKEGLKINVVNLFELKPLKLSKKAIISLKNSRYGGIVLDDDYVNGIAKNIAHDLNLMTSKTLNVLGLKDKSAGFYPKVDNLPPTAQEIRKFILKLIKDKKKK
jgi:pyruvate/2-oxoglutarate/acetoin dehydrogenase E1 component